MLNCVACGAELEPPRPRSPQRLGEDPVPDRRTGLLPPPHHPGRRGCRHHHQGQSRLRFRHRLRHTAAVTAIWGAAGGWLGSPVAPSSASFWLDSERTDAEPSRRAQRWPEGSSWTTPPSSRSSQLRGQPPRPPAYRSPPQWRRFRGDLPPGGLRLVGVDYPGSSPAGCRLLIGVSRQARARPAGGIGRRRQELPCLGTGLLGHPRRTTPSASATPTTSSRPWLRPGWTTPWTVAFGHS